MGHRTGVLPVSPELSVEPSCPKNSLSAGDDLAGWVLLLRARRSDSASPLSFPGQPHRVAFQERVWLFMARTRNRPASPPVPGDAGAEVTDEPVQVISRAAAIDVAKGSGMVCMRLPHESRAGRRTQKVWEVTATFAAVVALMDHLVCQGVERLVLESTSDQRLLAYLVLPGGGGGPGGVAGQCPRRQAPAGPVQVRPAGLRVAVQAERMGHAAPRRSCRRSPFATCGR